MELKIFKRKEKTTENIKTKRTYHMVSQEEVDNYAIPDNDIKVAHFTHTDIAGKVCGLLGERTFKNVDTFYCSNKDVDDIINTFIVIEKKYNDYDLLLVSDVSLNKGTLVNLNNVKTKTSSDVMYITHQPCYLEYSEKYSWLTCIPEYCSDDITVRQDSASVLYRELANNFSLPQDEWLDELIEKSRRYTTWEWFELNDLSARGLSMLCHDIGHKFFVRQLIRKHIANDDLLDEEDLDKLEYLEAKYQEYKELKINEVILCKINGYKTAAVMAELFIDRLGADIAYHYKNLDEVMIINSFVKSNFRVAHNSPVDVYEVAKIFGGNDGGNKKAAGASVPVEVRESIIKHYIDISMDRYNKSNK